MPDYRSFLAFLAALVAANQQSVTAQVTYPRGESRPSAAAAPAYPPGNYNPQDRMEAVDPDKKLSAGDEVTLEIEQDREGGFPKIVSATGEIEVSPVGRVKVAGKTTTEAQADIKRQLEKDYYYTATVRLSLDRRSRGGGSKIGQITLSGEIRTVGPMDLVEGDKLTVSQAVLKAGGFGPFGNSKRVQVTRTEDGRTRQFEVNVKKVTEEGALDLDVPVQHGDRIHVPRVWGKF